MKFQRNIPKNLSAINFFSGWPKPYGKAGFKQILQNSEHTVFALNDDNKLIGFICAISDKTSVAFITYLEVVETHRGSGVGTELVKQILKDLSKYYAVDLICDENLHSFYEQAGFKKSTGMSIRNYHKQGSPAMETVGEQFN